MKPLDYHQRIWIVLSAVWLVIFGVQSVDAWGDATKARQENERAKVEAFAETMYESRGIESFPGSADVADSERERTYLEREAAEKRFTYSLLLALVGPLLIWGALQTWKWVVAGRP